MKTTRLRAAIAAILLTGSTASFAVGAGRAMHDTGSTRAAAATVRTTPSATTTTTRGATTRQTAMRGPTHTGQPMAECGSASAPNTPGQSSSAPGSAFNGDGVAGTKYAGEQPQNSRNTASVSQYDAACLHQKR